MKLGDIKLETLKLMFATYETFDSYADMYNDNNNADYLNKMPGTINRALDRIRTEKKQKENVADLEEYILVTNPITKTIDLSKIEDLDQVKRISHINTIGRMTPSINYNVQGEVLFVDNIKGTHSVVYTVKIPTITDETSDSLEFDFVNEEVARLIPYFLKAELLEEEQPEQAAQARLLFEQTLASIGTPSIKQTRTKNVYRRG